MKIETKKAPNHAHCDMCEDQTYEYYVCLSCHHIECIPCYDGWIEGPHPCKWLQYKNEQYAKPSIWYDEMCVDVENTENMPPLKEEHRDS